MFASPHMQLLEAASRHERIFLAALVMVRRCRLTPCSSHIHRGYLLPFRNFSLFLSQLIFKA